MRLPAPLALLVGAGLLLVAAPPASAAIAYAPCGPAAALQCGSLDVPLDRSGAVGGAVRLAAVRKVAPSNPTSTAVLGLVGGPGGAAIPSVSDFARLLAPALTTRDLLMFDPRGVGASSPISCALGGLGDTAAGTRCSGRLGKTRGLYASAANVEDIEALRAESGYERLVFYAVSYGTKVALDYAARYPDRVAGLVLDSVVLPEGEDPLQRSTFAAMRRVLAELCAGSECRGISANVVGDLAGRVRSLARKPLSGYLTSAKGARLHGTIDRRDLFDVVLGGDRNPTLRAELPAALTSARRGDSAPLIRLWARSADIIALRHQAPGADFNDTIFAATLCEESIFPWDRATGPTARSQQINAVARGLGEGTFSPFDSATALTTTLVKLCVGWPVITPPFAAAGPIPNVPTLVIDGQFDLRTPLEDASKIKALIPDAQILAVPFTGHSALSSDVTDDECASRAVAQFFADQPVAPCTQTDNPFSPVPVAPTQFNRLQPTRRGGKVGRTITAALATAQDMRRQVIGDTIAAGQLPSRAGGLRGGRAVVRGGPITLLGVVYVPGVEVSGTVPVASGRQVLRIGGSKAAHGSLTVSATSITGRLGGRRISIGAQAAGAAAATGMPSPAKLDRLLRHLRPRSAG
ncbi:MAG TPA: alpha/beta fold hydrolase [Solirubrobacteraceae bacterium]|jgi:pimeloyl-ACP methyl ester carboxylesterase|nr:alpha/beta fold hydrolase [Solirubrobacteraceae bacterium]